MPFCPLRHGAFISQKTTIQNLLEERNKEGLGMTKTKKKYLVNRIR